MMKTLHIQPQLTDYALDLLPLEEKRAVEQHAALCENCRQALEKERLIGQAVRETLAAVAQPTATQLHRLMPTPPRRIAKKWFTNWHFSANMLAMPKPLAVLAVMIMLFVGSLSLGSGSYTAVVATMTATSTTAPTATLTQKDNVAQPTIRPEEFDLQPEATPLAQLAPNPYTN